MASKKRGTRAAGNEPPFDPGLTQSYGGRLDRIINRDGSFNVHRRGTRLRDFHFYKFLIRLSWLQFMGVLFGTFAAVSAVFACLYLAIGLGSLQGAESRNALEGFLNAFFFSVQTLTTVGYGLIAPRALGADAVAAVEAMLGVMGFAFAAGLIYGRFARPTARILWSSRAVIAPFQGKSSLQFRVANQRSNAIVDLEATVVLMTVEGSGAKHRRSYVRLELERPRVFFLPLTWTIVHPIDEASPLHGRTPEDLAANATESLVLIRGFDDTFSQVVNARFSYRFDEIRWGYRFMPAFHNDEDGHLVLDLTKMDDTYKV
jgi:inward rectifier potassium channel